jgi:hypothetical protein
VRVARQADTVERRNMKSSFLKGAVVGGIAGAVMAAATVAFATTTTFLLGTNNKPDAATAVVAQNKDGLGGLNAPMLRLTNLSTGPSATPLVLNPGAGRPPLVVNSPTKVPGLNADRIDNLDSSAFLRSERFGGAQGSNEMSGGAGLGHPCALAEVTLFAGNFAPTGWDFAHGQIMRIDMNQALFSLLGTTYGGNGQTTFALPNLSGLEPDGVNYIICVAGVYPS